MVRNLVLRDTSLFLWDSLSYLRDTFYQVRDNSNGYGTDKLFYGTNPQVYGTYIRKLGTPQLKCKFASNIVQSMQHEFYKKRSSFIMKERSKFCRETLVVKTSLVLPPDTNNYGTLFGGKLMAYIDDVAGISAMRHARNHVVTASSDSVDFLHPINEGNSVCLESFVTYTGRTSMEVFVKVVAEDLLTGERNVCAMSFLTMVALDKNGNPTEVPQIIPETEEEKHLFETAKVRATQRKERREASKERAKRYGADLPW